MSTQCIIAKKTASGYKSIYCYYDGYPEGVGAMLKRHYMDSKRVNALIALGDISSLNREIGQSSEKHGFGFGQMVDTWTLAYHRDRRESWKDTKPKRFRSYGELEMYAGGMAKYLYVYENEKWETHIL